jgi:hypothetical protein
MNVGRVTAILVLTLFAARRANADDERYVVVTSAGRIGTMTVTSKGNVFDTVYRVDDNGRGAKLDEHTELGSDGLPVRYGVTGKSWFGAPVDERFEAQGGRAHWQSLNEKGDAAAGGFYDANDGTPWQLALELRALLARPDHSLPVLPAGSLRLERVRDVTVDGEALTAYAVWGLGLEPTFVLARDAALVVDLAGWRILTSERHAGSYAELARLQAALNEEAMAKLTRQVTHPLSGPTWLVNARVFDAVTKTVSEPQNVVLFRGRIVGVRKDAPPPGVAVIDAGGGTLLPGLLDAHSHSDIWGGALNLAAGVTLTRDPGNENSVLLDLEDRIATGEILGPHIVKSGLLEGRTQFSANLGFVVGSLEEGLEKLRWYADHGYWGLKIYNSITPDWVKPLAAEAHRLGLHVSGHVPAFMSSDRAIRDGYDEITHINQLVLGLLIDVAKEDTRTVFRVTALGERAAGLDLEAAPFRNLVALMKQHHTALDPTMAIHNRLLLGRPGKAAPLDADWLDHMPVSTQRSRRSAALDIKPASYPSYEASWSKLQAILFTLYREGIPLVPGTDSLPGFVLHSELEAWVQAGIPAGDVLALATLGGARFLGIDQERGSVATGKVADLYLVEGDPTQDIGAIRKGRLVIRGENAYYPDEIHAAFGIRPFAPRAEVKKPAPR